MHAKNRVRDERTPAILYNPAGQEGKNGSSEPIFPTDENLLVCIFANVTSRVTEAI